MTAEEMLAMRGVARNAWSEDSYPYHCGKKGHSGQRATGIALGAVGVGLAVLGIPLALVIHPLDKDYLLGFGVALAHRYVLVVGSIADDNVPLVVAVACRAVVDDYVAVVCLRQSDDAVECDTYPPLCPADLGGLYPRHLANLLQRPAMPHPQSLELPPNLLA